MKKILAWSLGGLLILGAVSFAGPQETAKSAAGSKKEIDVSGKWSGTFEHKNKEGEMKSEPVYMILKQDGDKLTGSGGPHESEQHPIQNGKVAGDRLTFEAVPGSMTISFDLKVDGDQITGNMTGKDKESDKTRTAKISLKRVAEK